MKRRRNSSARDFFLKKNDMYIMFCCLFLTLVLAGNLARASHDICTAIAGVNCGGGHDLVPLKNATVVSTPGACCAI